MRDADQFPGSLLCRFATQLRNAIFGHDVVDIVLAGADVRARRQHRHDAGKGVAFCRRRQHDERLAAPRPVGRAHEIGLPASS